MGDEYINYSYQILNASSSYVNNRLPTIEMIKWTFNLRSSLSIIYTNLVITIVNNYVLMFGI